MSLKIARRIIELIQQNKEVEIRKTLDPFSLKQRRCIISINHKRSSLLFIAVANKRTLIVTYFLESCGADPNSFGWIDYERLGCLAVAIDVNSETLVRILLKHGADTEVVSSCERTPLFHACSNDRERIVRLLIEHGANINRRNYTGETPLIESTNNLELFKYLTSMGTNVNSQDDCGHTALMVACETERDEIIYFLLSCKNTDIRIRNDYGEDALHLAIRHCSEDIVDEIINRGSYTKNEIIKVYELESCLSYVGNDVEKARELWQKALKLRSLPSDTPLFENQRPTGRLQEVIDAFNSDDVSAMSYLESVQGLNCLYTLGAYTCAACNVNDEDKYMILCEFLFDSLHTLNNTLFFKGIGPSLVLIRHYLYGIFSNNKSNLEKIFRIFVTSIIKIRLRLGHMTPQERTPHAYEIESLLYFIIEMVCKIGEDHSGEMNLFHKGIRRILKIDLRGLQQKSLMQICGSLHCPDSIMKCLIRYGANVNSTDREGKTVLHEVVESDMPSRRKIVKRIIKKGFDFSRVRCDEYCLPCRMERENIIPHSVKYISLQCLSARTLCEKTMNCFNDVPHYLRTIVHSHFFLT